MNMLRVNQFQYPHAPVSPTIAAVFNTAPGSLCDAVSVDYLINHHRSRFNALSNPPSLRDVFCPDACGQTIDAVVRELDRLVLGCESHYGQHWPKSFIAHYCHIVIDVCQHCRLIKQTYTVRPTLSTGQYLSAALLRVVHMIGHNLKLILIRHGADIDIGVSAKPLF